MNKAKLVKQKNTLFSFTREERNKYIDDYGRIKLPKVVDFTGLLVIIRLYLDRFINNKAVLKDHEGFESLKDLFAFYKFEGRWVTRAFYIWHAEPDESIAERIPGRMIAVRVERDKIDGFFHQLLELAEEVKEMKENGEITERLFSYIIFELSQLYDTILEWLSMSKMPAKTRSAKSNFLSWLNKRKYGWQNPAIVKLEKLAI